MKNDVRITLRLPNALSKALEAQSKKLFGRVAVSRLIRLLLDDYIKKVGVVYEDNNSDCNNQLQQ